MTRYGAISSAICHTPWAATCVIRSRQPPTCYATFATVRVEPDGGGQASRVLFGFDQTTRAWEPLSNGSAGYCEGYAPADVATHFTGCG